MPTLTWKIFTDVNHFPILSCLSGLNLAYWVIVSNTHAIELFPFFSAGNSFISTYFWFDSPSPTQVFIFLYTSTYLNNYWPYYLKQKSLCMFMLIKLLSYIEDQFSNMYTKLATLSPPQAMKSIILRASVWDGLMMECGQFSTLGISAARHGLWYFSYSASVRAHKSCLGISNCWKQ